MIYRMIKTNIYSVGAVDWDRTLFDSLMPLPHGTTYNAYLIRGSQKTVLIDTVEPVKFQDLRQNLTRLKVDRLDYIISNHAEQDHSGSLPAVLELFPMATLVTSKKGQDSLLPLLSLPADRIKIIEDRETLSLGDKTLQFIAAPWVHWPETMFTYLVEDKILFSCDLFGSHLAGSQLFASHNPLTFIEAKRYYAEIMMPFAGRIVKHLDTLQQFSIDLIAPSHGPIYDKPELIMLDYRQWVSDQVKNEVVLLYVSMHGSTEMLARQLVDALVQRGITVHLFNLATAEIGQIASALVDAATVIMASPAVLMGPHPTMVSAAYLMNALKPKTKFIGIIGSFGWGNKMVDQLKDLVKDLGAEFLPPLMIKGQPTEETVRQIEELAETVHQKHLTVLKSAL